MELIPTQYPKHYIEPYFPKFYFKVKSLLKLNTFDLSLAFIYFGYLDLGLYVCIKDVESITP